MMCFKEVELAKLEYDVVEEKRKLTEDICVENKIGFRMSEETKYKVLAVAPPDEKLLYITLLWEDADYNHNSLKKYYLRKQLYLRPITKLRNINRACEQMFKDGVDPYKIAKYYTTGKKQIQKEQEAYKKRIKALRKATKAKSQADNLVTVA